MTVCQFFLQGRCRYGQNCRFEHSYNTDDRNNRNATNTQQLNNAIKQIVGEVILAEKGGQWPLSCYSPIKEGPNIPGWEDVSPEEVRWKMYEARANGSLSQCINEINQLYSNAEKNRNLLKQPTMERVNLINLFGWPVTQDSREKWLPTINVLKGKRGASAPTNPFATSTSTNIFGGSTPQSNLFGASAQPAGSHGSIFGGSPMPNTQGNVFGGGAGGGQSTGTQGNIFGGTSPTFPNQNIFGGSASPTSFNQNMFSSPPPSNQNMFSSSSPVGGGGGMIFPSPTTQNIFSNVQTSNQSPATNAFSFPNTGVFGNQGASSPVFGSSNPFFQNVANKAPSQTANIFGGGQTENVFKSPNSFEKSGNVSAGPQPSGGSIFGVQGAGGNRQRPSAMDSSVYSKVEDLSEEEIKAFSAATFAFGKIPLKPPPQEYCN